MLWSTICMPCYILIIKQYLRVEKHLVTKDLHPLFSSGFRNEFWSCLKYHIYSSWSHLTRILLWILAQMKRILKLNFKMARRILGIKIMRTSDRIFKCFDTPCMTKYLSLIKLPLFTTLKSIQPNNFKRMKNFFLCIYVSICQKTCNIFYIMT